MEPLEQTAPNKPNFKLIVVLFALSIVVILVLAIFFVKHNEKHMQPGGKASPQSSMLTTPSPVRLKAFHASMSVA